MNNLEWAAENRPRLFDGFNCPQCAYMGDRCYREQPEDKWDERICAKGHAEWLMQPHEEPSGAASGGGGGSCGCEAEKGGNGPHRAFHSLTHDELAELCERFEAENRKLAEQRGSWRECAKQAWRHQAAAEETIRARDAAIARLKEELEGRDSFAPVIADASAATGFDGSIGFEKFQELVERCERLATKNA